MSLLTVNQASCSQCGICAEVCPARIICLHTDGPSIEAEEACLACGHCVAVCPHGALDHVKAPLAMQVPLPRFPVVDPVNAAAFLRSRRSIRNYLPQKVAREKILQLLDIARFAPTGCNSQGLSYLVIEAETILKQITERTIDWFEEQIKNEQEWAASFSTFVEDYRQNGIDTILRNAPCLLVALAPCQHPMGRDNARFCLEYVELYATSLGLGTCWAGLVEVVTQAGDSALTKVMQIPAEMQVAGVMMLGYPKYTYRRTPDREPVEVMWL